MSTYHDKVRALPAQASPALSGEEQAFYNLGHHAAQHAAGEIATQADAEIEALKAQCAALNRWIELGAIGEHRRAEHGGDFATCRKLGCINARGFLRNNSAGAELLAERDKAVANLEAFAKDIAGKLNIPYSPPVSTGVCPYLVALENLLDGAISAERRAAGRHDAAYDRVEVLLRREAELIEAVDVCEKGYHDLMSRALEAERRAEAAEVKESGYLADIEELRKQRDRLSNECAGWLVQEAGVQLAEARAERAEQKHEAATKRIAKLTGLRRALEIYAKEENWYEAEDGATHRQYFTIYGDGRHLHGWEIAQQALLAPQERGAEGYRGILEKALPIVEAEAERREYAHRAPDDKDPYYTEMRELADEITAALDPAAGAEGSAIYQVCNQCGRKTWAGEEFFDTCWMSQPDGGKCAGRFQPTGEAGKVEGEEDATV